MNDSTTLKYALRQQAVAIRAQLPMEVLSAAICENILAWPRFQQSSTVLFYYPFRNEINLLRLMTREPDKTYYLPRLIQKDGMTFYRYESGDILESNSYGIPEPPSTGLQWHPEEGGFVLLPGLMFDRSGFRLGYGKGYYDRFVDVAAKSNQHSETIILAGAIPEALVIEKLPRDSWDRPATYLITELQIVNTQH